mmetsp:Transcript_3020/g.7005  ORF Transcript_3020/g.7005 Transcript_3020/m.7005 type:complete len:205 (+) Transcript_3020:55-669(+)
MPKLYYTPVSCGAASVIAAVAAGVKIDCEQVDIGTHITNSGADYYSINPKGNVPCLVLDDGTVLNEGAAVLQYIADQAPGTVAAENGTSERYLIQNALNYVASEVHASFGPLFGPLSEEAKAAQIVKLGTKFSFIEKNLLGGQFLVGGKFSIADSYLYICLSWAAYLGVDLAGYPKVQAYFAGIHALPQVAAAHALMATNPSST